MEGISKKKQPGHPGSSLFQIHSRRVLTRLGRGNVRVICLTMRNIDYLFVLNTIPGGSTPVHTVLDDMSVSCNGRGVQVALESEARL